MVPKRRKQVPEQRITPLEEKTRALAAEQAKIEAEIARQQRVITEAPVRAEERKKLQRDELINRASSSVARPAPVVLSDRRFSGLNAAVPARQRGLRAERRRGRLLFFVLFVALIGVAWWAYFTVKHS